MANLDKISEGGFGDQTPDVIAEKGKSPLKVRFDRIKRRIDDADAWTLQSLLESAEQLESETSSRTRNSSSEKNGREFSVKTINERKQEFLSIAPNKRAAFLQSYYNRYKASAYRDTGFELALADLFYEMIPESNRGKGQLEAFTGIIKELDPYRTDRLQIVADLPRLKSEIQARANILGMQSSTRQSTERVIEM